MKRGLTTGAHRLSAYEIAEFRKEIARICETRSRYGHKYDFPPLFFKGVEIIFDGPRFTHRRLPI